MRRAQDILSAPRARQADSTLPLRPADVVITTMASLATAYLVIFARWVPGWEASALTFAVIAAGPPVFRALHGRFPKAGVFDVLASFWLLPSVIVGHFALGPLVDALNPRLLDHTLALWDLRLFGAHPSVVLGHFAGPAITELLMVCYYSYFVGPFGLALLLWFGKSPRHAWDEYSLALAIFFSANFLLYAAVPAIGPRYYLAGIFEEPLQGLWLTPYLDGLLRRTSFARDCFPSGHTGVTLIMLIFAWRYQRRFFWVMLPIGTGLILGTLVGRFHYGIDLLAAVPLVITCAWLGVALTRPGTAPARAGRIPPLPEWGRGRG